MEETYLLYSLIKHFQYELVIVYHASPAAKPLLKNSVYYTLKCFGTD